MSSLSSTVTELLAPAGDWDCLRAAVANGADAVYFGLGNFNARYRATNFSFDELPRVMEYLHGHNVRGYVALNILTFSDELADMARAVGAVAAAGVDAVIVQDLGLARLIHSMAPVLPLHASTQMTLTQAGGISFVEPLGIQRVILARELTIKQITAVAGASPVPVEVFIHGALCVAYSGQCLTSESFGGRSANRGQCRQACRLPYDLIVDGRQRPLGDKAYLLSPQDLAALDLVDQLVAAGVRALKIEGRLKGAHYVAATTSAYRAALDAALARRPFTPTPQQQTDLAQSFSRGFTHGFLSGIDHQELVNGRFPKSRGIRIGTVTGHTSAGIVVDIEPSDAASLPSIKNGDGVVFDQGHPEQWEQGGCVFEVRPSLDGRKQQQRYQSPRCVELIFGNGDVNLPAVAVGSIVWKTADPAVRRRLEQTFARDVVARRVPISVHVEASVGQPLRVAVTDANGRIVSVISAAPLQAAIKHTLSLDLLREQFGRLGDSPFILGDVKLRGPDGPASSAPVMAPKSVLNDLRRQAVEQLLALRASQQQHAIAAPHALDSLRKEAAELSAGCHWPDVEPARAKQPTSAAIYPLLGSPSKTPAARGTPAGEGSPLLHVLVRTMDQLHAALAWRCPDTGLTASTIYCDFEDIRRYRDAVAAVRAAPAASGDRPAPRVALATLRVIKPGEDGLLRLIADCQPDAVLVRNLAAVAFLKQNFPDLPLIGDYALNVANELTAAILIRAGLQRLTPGYDLSWEQFSAMLARIDPRFFEMVIHQHMPMFHMEHCVFAHVLSSGHDYHDCGRPCDRHQVDLRDRVGVAHPLVADAGCRNTLFNAQPQSAADYLGRMKQLGLRHFRVELLRQRTDEVSPLLSRYARLLAGLETARTAFRQLRVLNQIGVTAGTLDRD